MTDKPTLYIAGPMTGYPDSNYPTFRAAESDLRNAGFDVLCPVDSEQHNTTGEPQAWDWYMRHALRMVVDADGLALLPGWEESRGAQLEVHVARERGMKRLAVTDWLTGLVTA